MERFRRTFTLLLIAALWTGYFLLAEFGPSRRTAGAPWIVTANGRLEPGGTPPFRLARGDEFPYHDIAETQSQLAESPWTTTRQPAPLPSP